ncbi:MAG: alpha/beta hydrolase [Anaerolineales bacterium]
MRQTFFYKNGYRLSYADYGDKNGYPILIQHGLIASIDDYHLFDRLIETGARLICIARPGYGESSSYEMSSFAEWAEIVSVLVDELELFQFDILGMSSGAPYSYALGHGFPDKVRNIFIFSGIPALYDEIVLQHWPYEMAKDKDMAFMEDLAHELFFSHIQIDDLQKNDIRDSMMNNGFGVAQDLRLRTMDWGFHLSDVKAPVFMRHSKVDDNVPFETAVRTAELLPNCKLELLEKGPHFSEEALDDFIQSTMLHSSNAFVMTTFQQIALLLIAIWFTLIVIRFRRSTSDLGVRPCYSWAIHACFSISWQSYME